MSAARFLDPRANSGHSLSARPTERFNRDICSRSLPRIDLISQDGAQWLLRIIDHSKHKPRLETPTEGLQSVPALRSGDACGGSFRDACRLLNKYNVVPHHLLIITRHFESQESALTQADFQALWTCLAEYDSLGFYNSGESAGASQPHKHLQTVPLPMHDQLEIHRCRWSHCWNWTVCRRDKSVDPGDCRSVHFWQDCDRDSAEQPDEAAAESLRLVSSQ